MRQTTLTVQQIKGHLDGVAMQPYPKCLLINELGELARKFGADTAKAQKILVELLESEDTADRWIAIKCLKEAQEAGLTSRDTDFHIAAFSNAPENAGIR